MHELQRAGEHFSRPLLRLDRGLQSPPVVLSLPLKRTQREAEARAAVKAVLLRRDCILPTQGEVSGEVKAGLRALAETNLLTILLGTAADVAASGQAFASRAVAAIEAAGGRIDAVVSCPHPPDSGCDCWATRPGLILEAANRFDLQRNGCYMIAATQTDVDMAVAAGVRPVLVLQGRRIGEILGDSGERKDFPIARSLAQAVEYIQAEERISAQIGKPRQTLPPTTSEEIGVRPAMGGAVVTPISRAAIAASRRIRLRPREVGRWLSFLVVGGVWLSLGIAYLLTHLYRAHPFPEVVWYITLQFIPRVARGVLFILTGVAVLVLASWSFLHTFGNGQALRRR